MPLKPIIVTSVSPDFVEFDEDEEVEELQPVNEWIREYAKIAAPKPIPLTLGQVREAVKDDFPELAKSDLDMDRLLEEVGIHVTADEREFVVAWYGVIGEDLADELLEKYKQVPYSNVRKKLGIDYLWVMSLHPKLWHSINASMEAIVEFHEIEDKPECCVVNL
jgi:hypothetical protein